MRATLRSRLPAFLGLLSGITASLLVMALARVGLLRPLSQLEYWVRFSSRGPTAWDSRITLVAIDDASLEQFGAFPWSRSLYADLLDQLQAADPSVIVLNLILTDPSGQDERLAQAMTGHEAVVLAMTWDRDGEPLLPVPTLADQAIGSGHVYQQQDPTGFVRTVRPELQGQPALGVTAAKALSMTQTAVPLPPLERPLWINWPGPAQALTTVSFADAIANRVDPSHFRNRIVIVGATATGLNALPTPYDINPPASGVHLHAAVIDNLLQQRWLRPVLQDWWLIASLGPLAGLLLGQRSLRWQLGLLSAAILAWSLIALALMLYAWWLPVVEPVLVLVLTAFILLLDDIVYRKRMEMELRTLNLTLEDQVWQRTQQLHQLNRDLLQEVKERQHIQEQLAYEACHDVLTQLPNRKLFLQQLQQQLSQCQQTPTSYRFAVLFLDCDRFKLINDSFGHWVGDALLRSVAEIIRDCVRPVDTIARFGGDEFTILLPGISGAEEATEVAQRIRRRFTQALHIHQHQLFTNASIGIVVSHPSYQYPDELLRDADIAMYQAKTNNLGYALFEPGMHQRVRNSLQMETELRLALGRQELRLYYQPIVALNQPQILGCEALVRWEHHQRGLISPDEFIPVAEETGLIFALGRWVLEEACSQFREWQRRGYLPPEAVISVNLSVAQFLQPNLLDQIDAALQRADLPSHCLKLEITETAIMSDTETAVHLIDALKQRGIKLSIDDFGTGHSSLGYLQRFPVDVLKIDRQFIQDIHGNARQLGIVEAIIKLAHHLDMQVIAEGIEYLDQLQALRRLGCQYGQGYLFSHPLPATAFCQWLQQMEH